MEEESLEGRARLTSQSGVPILGKGERGNARGHRASQQSHGNEKRDRTSTHQEDRRSRWQGWQKVQPKRQSRAKARRTCAPCSWTWTFPVDNRICRSSPEACPVLRGKGRPPHWLFSAWKQLCYVRSGGKKPMGNNSKIIIITMIIKIMSRCQRV
jgi:hypothetical protein